MNAKTTFLFLSMIFVGANVFAQNKLQKNSNNNFASFNFKAYVQMQLPPTIAIKPMININATPYNLISPNYYTQHFGFFCKKELQLEKATKIPFKFRLGSVEQCDRLEGKQRFP